MKNLRNNILLVLLLSNTVGFLSQANPILESLSESDSEIKKVSSFSDARKVFVHLDQRIGYDQFDDSEVDACEYSTSDGNYFFRGRGIRTLERVMTQVEACDKKSWIKSCVNLSLENQETKKYFSSKVKQTFMSNNKRTLEECELDRIVTLKTKTYTLRSPWYFSFKKEVRSWNEIHDLMNQEEKE